MASTFSRIMAMKIANKFFENFMYQINFHVVYFLEELLLLSKCEHSFAAWFHTILNSNSYESFYDDKNKFFLQTTIYIFFHLRTVHSNEIFVLSILGWSFTTILTLFVIVMRYSVLNYNFNTFWKIQFYLIEFSFSVLSFFFHFSKKLKFK